MTINLLSLEEDLFDLWRNSLPAELSSSFVTDGAVDPESYVRSKLKILLLLKEVNDPDGGGWCLRTFLHDGGRPETWNTVTRWLRAIREINKEINWNEIANVTEQQRCQEMLSIAAMNLKKTPGGHTTELKSWWQAIDRDREYVRKQFYLYNADLVICCGSAVANAFDAFIKSPDAPQWQLTTRGVEYIEYSDQKFLISFAHPEARVSANLIHYGLVDAVRELIGQRQASLDSSSSPYADLEISGT